MGQEDGESDTDENYGNIKYHKIHRPKTNHEPITNTMYCNYTFGNLKDAEFFFGYGMVVGMVLATTIAYVGIK